jgi:hypothetical protein
MHPNAFLRRVEVYLGVLAPNTRAPTFVLFANLNRVAIRREQEGAMELCGSWIGKIGGAVGAITRVAAAGCCSKASSTELLCRSGQFPRAGVRTR